MPEKLLALSFACGACATRVRTLASAPGHDGGRGAARVKVPCPACRQICDVIYDPHGRVLDVLTCVRRRPVPQPSVN